MRLRYITLAGIILLALAFTIGTGMADTNGTQANITDNNTGTATDDDNALVDDIEPDDSLIGPGNALYGLRIAFEHLDVTFTFNASEKLGKQVSHARQRIAEAKAELRKKNSAAADKAFEEYKQEIDKANDMISGFSGNEPGLLDIQLMIVKHQYVLEQLLNATPNSTGLQRAYNNSLNLENKFRVKTERKFERMMTKTGKKILKQVREEIEKEEGAEIKAELTGYGANVRVKVQFVSNATDENAIASETLSKLKMSKETIGNLLKLEEEIDDDTPAATPTVAITGTPTATLTTTPTAMQTRPKPAEVYKEKLEAKAKVEGNVSEVKVEFKFRLNATNRNEIIDMTYDKLASLTSDDVLEALKFEVKKERKEAEKTKIIGRKDR